jgi:hypothetical protein
VAEHLLLPDRVGSGAPLLGQRLQREIICPLEQAPADHRGEVLGLGDRDGDPVALQARGDVGAEVLGLDAVPALVEVRADHHHDERDLVHVVRRVHQAVQERLLPGPGRQVLLVGQQHRVVHQLVQEDQDRAADRLKRPGQRRLVRPFRQVAVVKGLVALEQGPQEALVQAGRRPELGARRTRRHSTSAGRPGAPLQSVP